MSEIKTELSLTALVMFETKVNAESSNFVHSSV
jgi:hypothetical protein